MKALLGLIILVVYLGALTKAIIDVVKATYEQNKIEYAVNRIEDHILTLELMADDIIRKGDW